MCIFIFLLLVPIVFLSSYFEYRFCRRFIDRFKNYTYEKYVKERGIF